MVTDVLAPRAVGCTRRGVLAAAASLWTGAPAAALRRLPPLWSAWSAGTGVDRYRAGQLGSKGVALPARAHQVIADPRRNSQAYAVARRPGEWLWRVDLKSNSVVRAIALDDLRRFEGHLLYRPFAGAHHDQLVSVETNTDTGAGLLGLRDPDSLALRDEWATHGVGPHEVIAWGDQLLAVANGGLLTLPETGREVRNAGPLHSSVCAIDSTTGTLRGEWTAPNADLSLRHLATSADGCLGVAMQSQNAPTTAPVLAILPPNGGAWIEAEGSTSLFSGLKGYAGAIAANGNEFAVTCPQGDAVAIWSSTGRLVACLAIPGAWGIASHEPGWMVSNAAGERFEITARTHRVTAHWQSPGLHWDNHIS